jgi:hypothetical protein
MANTYSQINMHCVFAVKGRENFITRNVRDDLHRYISGILKKDGSYPLAVNGWMDHVHAFSFTASASHFLYDEASEYTYPNYALEILPGRMRE